MLLTVFALLILAPLACLPFIMLGVLPRPLTPEEIVDQVVEAWRSARRRKRPGRRG